MRFLLGLVLALAATAQTKVDWVTQLRNIPQFDVRTYGAKGDGVANDYPAIAAALAACPAAGCSILFPDRATATGVYRILSPIVLTRGNIRLSGSSAGTTIQYAGGAAVSILSDNGTTTLLRFGIVVENLTIYGNASVTNGLKLNSVHHSTFQNLRLGNVPGACMLVAFAVANTYADLSCSRNPLPGSAWTVQPATGFDFAGGGSAAFGATASTITRAIVEGVSGSGLRFGVTLFMNVIAGTSEGNARGIEVYGDTYDLIVNGMDFEENSIEDVRCDKCMYSSFYNLNSTKLFNLVNGRGVTLHGGQYNDITLSGTTAFSMLMNVFIGGTLIDGNPDLNTKMHLLTASSGSTKLRVDELSVLNFAGAPTAVTIRQSPTQGANELLRFMNYTGSETKSKFDSKGNFTAYGDFTGSVGVVGPTTSTAAGTFNWRNGAGTLLGQIGDSGADIPFQLFGSAKFYLYKSGATSPVALSSLIGGYPAGNAAAPGAVPGCSADLTFTITGAQMGDTVVVTPTLVIPAGMQLMGFVSAADTVKVRWCQFSGAAADPDGGGGANYRIDIWQH